jgi:hypothetical protein
MGGGTPVLDFFYEALASDHGVEIATPDPARLRQQLYPIRKQDPMFECLSLVVPAKPGVLWIVKRRQP